MTTKYNPTYTLTLGTEDGLGDIVINYPLTLIFNVDRTTSGATGVAQLQIYNLSYNHRKRIFQDVFTSMGPQFYKPVNLQAGYGGSLSTVFKGNYRSAYTVREGVNDVTYIDCFDGAYDTINIKTYTSLAKGTSNVDILKRLANDFPHLNTGTIEAELPTSARPVVLEGNTWDLMRSYSNNQAFIDCETINILGAKYALKGSVPLLNAGSGLLSTPRREGGFVMVRTLFEPALVLGQIVQLQSVVQPVYDGQYKVASIRHNGIISGAVNGRRITEVGLVRPTVAEQGFTVVQ